MNCIRVLLDENSLVVAANSPQMNALREELWKRYGAEVYSLPYELLGRDDEEVADYARKHGFDGILTQDEDFVSNPRLYKALKYIFLVQRVPAGVCRQEWRVIVYRVHWFGVVKEEVFGVTPAGELRNHWYRY